MRRRFAAVLFGGLFGVVRRLRGETPIFGCLVPRRLSLKRARKGRREGDNGLDRLYPSHGPLRSISIHSFRARLRLSKETSNDVAFEHVFEKRLSF